MTSSWFDGDLCAALLLVCDQAPADRQTLRAVAPDFMARYEAGINFSRVAFGQKVNK